MAPKIIPAPVPVDASQVATLRDARARTHSPSDALAWAWDEQLMNHPEWCSTDADYPGWTPGAKAVA